EELEGVIRVSVVATGIDKPAADISAAPVTIRQPQKPVQQQRPAEARPAAPAPAQPEAARAIDPVAEAIRAAEMNAELAAAAAPRPAAEPEFRPDSTLFRQPAAPQPAAVAPMRQPVAPEHVPVAAEP